VPRSVQKTVTSYTLNVLLNSILAALNNSAPHVGHHSYFIAVYTWSFYATQALCLSAVPGEVIGQAPLAMQPACQPGQQ
jgi:hypothetical protein